MTTESASEVLHQINVRCCAGRPFSLAVPTEDGDGDPLAAAAVVSARAQIRATVDAGGAALHEFSTADDTITAIDGFLTLTATSAETTAWGQDWSSSTAWWDLEITDPDGERWQMLRPGKIVVTPEVTR